MDHYTCYQVHITNKYGGVVDTGEFSPYKTAMPQTSSNHLTDNTDLELSKALLNPYPADPFSHIGTAQIQALHQLSDFHYSPYTNSGPTFASRLSSIFTVQ
jgi:hypothetical protein